MLRDPKNEWATVIEDRKGEENISHRLTVIFHPPPLMATCTKSLVLQHSEDLTHRLNIIGLPAMTYNMYRGNFWEKTLDNDRNYNFKSLQRVTVLNVKGREWKDTSEKTQSFEYGLEVKS